MTRATPEPKQSAPAAASEAKQNAPTQPRPMDGDGRLLDGHGLPIGGPARIAALDGKPDPALSGVETVAPIVKNEGEQ
jgi:hypothetical protein